jgi:hypothetical protein
MQRATMSLPALAGAALLATVVEVNRPDNVEE